MISGKQTAFLLALLLLTAFASPAQDTGFSQFYSNPLYLNPAFAGSLGVPRINLQYRDQWHSLPDAYVTQSASFDFPAEKLRGGIGFNLIRDAQSNHLLNAYQFNFIYTSIFRLTPHLMASGAIQAGFQQNSLDWNGLIFADNVDIYYGNHRATAEMPPTDPEFHFFDFATGIMVFGDRFFGGIAAHHLAEPSQSWYTDQGSGDRLRRKYTLHAGTRVPVHLHGHWRKSFDLLPQLVLLQQGSYRQFNYGMLADYKGLTAGAWFRQDLAFHYDALIFLVGYMKKRWHLTYSYDFTVSGLGAQSGGTSEISVGFLLKDFTQSLAFPFYRPYRDFIGE